MCVESSVTLVAPFVLAEAIAQKERELYALRSELARQRASSRIPEAEAVIVRCRLGEHNVALLTSEVSEVLRMAELSTIPDAPVWFMGLLAIGSQRIPVIDLFAHQTGRRRTPDPSELIVLTETRSGPCGLVVDEVAELVTIHGSQVFRPAPDAPFGAHLLGTVTVGDQPVLLLSAAPLSLEDVDLTSPNEVAG
jgi:purine-binding chemotaxis protein CheW